MTHVTCRLTAKHRDQLRNPTLGNRVWATFTFLRIVRILLFRKIHTYFNVLYFGARLSSNVTEGGGVEMSEAGPGRLSFRGRTDGHVTAVRLRTSGVPSQVAYGAYAPPVRKIHNFVWYVISQCYRPARKT